MNLNELTNNPAWSDADKLVILMKEWSEAYYVNGNSPTEDAVYDASRRRLEVLDSYHPYLAVVGAPVNNSTWKTLQHKHPVGSLDKIKSKSEFESWIISLDKLDI